MMDSNVVVPLYVTENAELITPSWTHFESKHRLLGVKCSNFFHAVLLLRKYQNVDPNIVSFPS